MNWLVAAGRIGQLRVGRVLRLTARSLPRSSVRKINSWPEDPDEKPRDQDAHDQPQGAEWNPALSNAMISGIPGDDGRQE